MLSDVLKYASISALRQAHRRHDVVAVQVMDRFELHLPPIGRVVLKDAETGQVMDCLLYTSPSPRDRQKSRMPSSA